MRPHSTEDGWGKIRNTYTRWICPRTTIFGRATIFGNRTLRDGADPLHSSVFEDYALDIPASLDVLAHNFPDQIRPKLRKQLHRSVNAGKWSILRALAANGNLGWWRRPLSHPRRLGRILDSLFSLYVDFAEREKCHDSEMWEKCGDDFSEASSSSSCASDRHAWSCFEGCDSRSSGAPATRKTFSGVRTRLLDFIALHEGRVAGVLTARGLQQERLIQRQRGLEVLDEELALPGGPPDGVEMTLFLVAFGGNGGRRVVAGAEVRMKLEKVQEHDYKYLDASSAEDYADTSDSGVDSEGGRRWSGRHRGERMYVHSVLGM